MNNVNLIVDSHKRTSISQLLNPAAVTHVPSFSTQLPTFAAQTQPQQDHFQQPLNNGSSFNLRAANWGLPETLSKRTPENDATSTRSYHQHMNSVDGYRDVHLPQQSRVRLDDSNNNYSINDVQGWPQHQQQPPSHDIANLGYGAPVISPMYSDERTALSGDYSSHNQYSGEYQGHNLNNGLHTTWQSTERASVRIAARGSMQEPPPDPRYNLSPPYYPPSTIYGAISFPQQQQQQHHQQQEQQQQPPPLQSQSQKRPASPAQDAPAPKAKKARAKPKSGTEGITVPSKRGYNAKKRSEAAQIAAQNAQLMPTVSYTHVPTEKGKEKASDARMRIVSEDGAAKQGSQALHPELQFARCMSNRYRSEQFPRCVSCTRRWAGDTCRFQGIRFFLKDAQRNIIGVSFLETQNPVAPTNSFPTSWNVPLRPVHIRRTKRTIANSLLPILRQELAHLGLPEIIIRPRESEVRATCDTCMTSIFSSSWMCRLCGREACAECFEQVKELTMDRPGAGQSEIAALQVRRDKHAYSNPFFLSCTKRNEHNANDFSPMTRFCKAELERAIKDMEALLCETDIDVIPSYGLNGSAHDPRSIGYLGSPSPTNVPELLRSDNSTTDSSGVRTPPESVLARNITQSSKPLEADFHDSGDSATEIPSHPLRRFTDAELTEDVFRSMWVQGMPLVVTGLLSKFNIQWTPEYFIQNYKTQSCLIIECQTDLNKRVTIGEFFSWFGKYEDRTDCWKLKDWPPSTDFKTAFPELYEDFSRAVPVPNYVRRDGALNIASHFPSNTIAPDLGPKMYNAMAASQAPGSKGSTRLHMDMADALNIMTYAAPCPDGTPGCAAWDLFRSEDSDKIRYFLKKKYKGKFAHDPIHSQQVYLDDSLRRELYADQGVMSYRVYQKPGEAVFIPAGCAHQVCNMSDCVKVAVDFVSPENIQRCEKLTREFREQNQSKQWKEDVLQLRTMMWFAWISCCQQEKLIGTSGS